MKAGNIETLISTKFRANFATFVATAKRCGVAISELIYPTNCRICDARLDKPNPLFSALSRRDVPLESYLCPQCRRLLAAKPRTFCRRCGRVARWERGRGDDVECPQCRRAALPPFYFDEIRPMQFYRGLARVVALRLKQERDSLPAEILARLYFETRRRVLTAFHPDFVVAVPMFWTRRWARGVNSPNFFGAELARRLGVPFSPKTVRRIRATPPQSSVDWDARRENVADAFEIADSPQFSIDELLGKRAIIVDDVFTSGATTNELARILRNQGVDAILVATIARAGLGKKRRFDAQTKNL